MTSDEFEKIYTANYKALHGYLLALTKDSSTADDITHDAFIKFYANAEKFKGDCSELTMLCTIGKNLFLNSLRGAKKQTLSEMIETEDKVFSLEELVINRSMALKLHEKLHNLREPYKEVFSLHIFGELTFKEISGLFGKSESWAKMTFYRAKAMLVSELKEE